MNNYNIIQKYLHDFIFNNKTINDSLFEIEKLIYLKKNIKIKTNSHIFITGLPRSGTTSLLNFIYSSKEYGSLTYKNMPFVLSPNISKLFNKKKIKDKERMHGDGIFYNINSPESFDEVFFNNNNEFIKKELINYLTLILSDKNKLKYLSKNNLNYKRIDLISSILPNCVFLIPIREPLQHAYSLMCQHANFSKLQKNDDFIRRYMNYLGHNEFGLNHKPWNKPIEFYNYNTINYWLEQWYLFYKNIKKNYQFNNNCYFIIYEKLINDEYLELISSRIKLNKNKKLNLKYFTNSNKENLNLNFSQSIYHKTKNLYDNYKINS